MLLKLFPFGGFWVGEVSEKVASYFLLFYHMMGKSRRNGFVETAERESCDIGLGLMMETHQSFPCKKMNQMVMVMPHHEPQFFSGGFDGETGSSGPLFYSTSNNNHPGTSDICNAVCSDFGSVVPKTLQQPYYSDSLSFSSSGKVCSFRFIKHSPLSLHMWCLL